MNVLVAGSTGNLGRFVVRELKRGVFSGVELSIRRTLTTHLP
jgi:thioester reductase-like protein